MLREDRVGDLRVEISRCATSSHADHRTLLLQVVLAEVQEAHAHLPDILQCVHVLTLSSGRPAIARYIRRLIRAQREFVVVFGKVCHAVAGDGRYLTVPTNNLDTLSVSQIVAAHV